MVGFMKTLSLFLFFLIISNLTFSQIWERTFSQNTGVTPREIKEHYDKGYILGQGIAVGGFYKIGWLSKLDINGNVLWDKKIGSGSNLFSIHGIERTMDGGIIFTGTTDTLNYDQWDPYIVKMNSCAEVEWCRIFQTDTKTEFGIKVRALPDNSYTMLVCDWKEDLTIGVFLYHLSEGGDLLWEQEYFVNDSLVNSESPRSLEITSEGEYLITGYCYTSDTAQPQLWWPRPMIILADTSGEAIWELPWGDSSQFIGEGFQSVLYQNNYYSVISDYPYPPLTEYKPCLIKTSTSGSPLGFYDLKANTQWGKASTIDFLDDSVLFAGIGYTYDDTNSILSVVRIDTLGNIINEKILDHSLFIPVDAMFTSDQKYLVTAMDEVNNKVETKLWKLNLSLEYDSIYTQPMTYDSLCDHPITSETIFFPCDVIMSIVEPAMNTDKVKMLIYPNPARDEIHVRLPECIQIKNSTKHLTVTTTFHQWSKELIIQVTDISGRIILRQPIEPGEKEITLPVTGWKPGIYSITLWYGQKIAATEKVVVE